MRYITLLIAAGLLALILNSADTDNSLKPVCEMDKLTSRPMIPLEFIPVKDTIYVLGDSYILISLKHQKAALFLRSGEKYIYPVSTGSDKIHKGIKTSEGIYTVQSKYTTAISRQFNNAKLHYWIGFNYNIGFHGLEGNSYYKYLGEKPSSHGCVRISREDGEELFNTITIGTPVMVFDKSPARIFTFIDNSRIINNAVKLKIADKKTKSYMKKRLTNLYNGEAYLKNTRTVYLDGKTSLKPGGFAIGEAAKIPTRQLRPELNAGFTISKADNSLTLISKIKDKILKNNKIFEKD